MEDNTTDGRRTDERTSQYESDATTSREISPSNSWNGDRRTFVKVSTLLGLTGGTLGGLPAFTGSAAAESTAIEGVHIETVATNLDTPWGAAFRNGTLYVTERPGRIVKIDDGKREVVADYTAETVEGEMPVATSGLLGLAVHPSGDIAYTYQTYRPPDGGIENRVLEHDIENGFAYDVLFDGIPGAHWENGGRLAIKGDALHITVGQTSLHAQTEARNPHSLIGKTLRLTLDGDPYPTNPFADGEEGHPAVFTYGHRHPQGLAFRETGRLFATEHGPAHDDEINLLEAGNDYGWPTVMGPSDIESITDPLTSYTPTIAPSGATFYYGPISRWRDSFFFATLKDKTLYRLRFDHSDVPQLIEQEKLLEGEYGLLRTTFVGPDGHLYVTTSNRDGSPDAEVRPPSDKIIRLVPEDSPPAPPTQNTLKIEGTGDYAFYSFRATGDVDGKSLTSEDTVSGSTASGAVDPGSDTFTFEGDLRNLYVEGDANVFLNGTQIDPDTYESVVSFDGDGSYTAYSFTVKNGTITDTQSLTGEDSVTDDHAEGAVRADTDSYTFTGTFAYLRTDGDATVYVNGATVDPSNIGSDVHSITFEGTGSYASYEFTVSGTVEDGRYLDPEDSFSASHGQGAVRAGPETYFFTGTLENVTIDGEVTVAVDGEQIDPADYPINIITFEGVGEIARYEFAVTGNVGENTGVEQQWADYIEGSIGGGVVGPSQDSYTFTGELRSLTVDGEVVVTVNGEEIDENTI